MVEELLKALPVLCYALLLDDSRGRVLPIAMAVGVGFAVLENTVLLVEYLDGVTLAWAVARGFFRQPDARSLHGQHRHWHLLCKKQKNSSIPALWLTVHRNHHACPL